VRRHEASRETGTRRARVKPSNLKADIDNEKAACEQEFFTASSPRLASAAKAAPAASEIAKAAKTRKLHRIPVSPRGRRGIYRRCRRVAQVAAFVIRIKAANWLALAA
jgi:hypothetical protein